MLQRHKVPTIFNIYMLDVICCALGCVILLWQVAHREAEMQTAEAKDAHADAVQQSAAAKISQAEALKQFAAAMLARMEFEKSQEELLAASKDVAQLLKSVADWRSKYNSLLVTLNLTEKEREEARKLAASRQDILDKTQTNLALTEDQLKKLEVDLARLLAEQKKTNADLAGAKTINADLLTKLAAIQKDLALKQTELDLADKNVKQQLVALKLSEENARKLQTLLDALRDESKDTQTKLKLAELKVLMREQELDKSRKEYLDLMTAKNKLGKDLALGATDLADAKRLLAALVLERDQWKDKLALSAREKDKLNQRVLDLKAEVDQRFAGIPLTGQNVLFLIDTSGSMAMKDENTDDPDKWPFLCETLMKLMRSIPSLERFQVVLFSDKTRYLFGNRDSWLKYEGAETAKMTHDALRKIKVEGGTNMHDGLEEAFRYRKIKLDTIYLFSDGLPNQGPGLPASLRDASESVRSQVLGKFVRDKLKDDWNRPQAGMNDVRINAVGFFFESPDVGAFLWSLAREHKGNFVGLR